jgi:hypothetical protein
LFGVLVLYLLLYAGDKIGFALKARKGGWEVYADGREGVWVRKGESWGRWWRRVVGRPREDELLEIDGGTHERSWRAWMGGFGRREGAIAIHESRPLLS